MINFLTKIFGLIIAALAGAAYFVKEDTVLAAICMLLSIAIMMGWLDENVEYVDENKKSVK